MKKFLSISFGFVNSVIVLAQPIPTEAEGIIKAYNNKEFLIPFSSIPFAIVIIKRTINN